MRAFEKSIEEACAREEIPGVVLMAADRSRSLDYAKAFGKRSVREGADQSPLQLDAVMWIASCTKVITSIAAAQCVERGLLFLDRPIYDVLPEFKDKPVITGFEEDGTPILEPHRRPITLRHLLNHSSGLAYDEVHPKLQGWLRHHKRRPSRAPTPTERFDYPLVFEAGSSWCYGAGVDWAGVMVERVNPGRSLQQYFEENIFQRVRAADLVFAQLLHERKGMVARLADMSKRDPGSGAGEGKDKVKRSNAKLQFVDNTACFGGLGLFASAPAFFRVVHGLLLSDQYGILLMVHTTEEFFRPSLEPGARKALNDFLRIKEARDGMGLMPEDVEKDWGLGGLLSVQDVPGGRRAGSMTWGGMPNITWFVDRKAGLCGLYAGQLLPPGDPKSADLTVQFEKGIYEMQQSGASKL